MPTATAQNSLCTVAEADAYFDTRLHADAWTAIEEGNEDKDRALIAATRLFSTYLQWADKGFNGVAGDENGVGQVLKDACCEMALVLLQGDVQVKDDMEGIASISLSGMSIVRGSDRKSIIPPHVFRMIAHLAKFKMPTGIMDVVRS